MVLLSPENPAGAGFSLAGLPLALDLLAGEAADRPAGVAVVAAGRIDVARAEVEVVGGVGIVRSRRPIITLAACVPQRPKADAPAGMEIQRRLSNGGAIIGTI